MAAANDTIFAAESCEEEFVQNPFLTVVMPVRNEERFIADTLEQLLNQDYPQDRFEIIVADGQSDDSTCAIVTEISQRYPQVRLFPNPKRRSSSGRNIGFQQGRGDAFIVVDGHCHIPDRNLLKNTADLLRDHPVDCLGRPQPLTPPGLSSFQRAVALARASRLGHGADSLIFGDYEGYASPVSNGATYTRAVFDKAGYVDENFDAAEDVEFNYRVEQAGFKCYSSAKLSVYYYPRDSHAGLFRQMTRYGTGRFNFIRKHPEALSFNQLIPPLFVLGGIITALLTLITVFWGGESPWIVAIWKLCLAAYILYFVIIAYEAIRIGRKSDTAYIRYLPTIFLMIHAGMGFGFLRRMAETIMTKSAISQRVSG